MKELMLRYNKSAQDSDWGWENESLPIGNGYLGANIFGIPNRERIQITENSLVNDYFTGGLNNFAEIYIEFDHNDVTQYERGLILNDAISFVKYDHNGVEYKREYFASYPDKVLVMKFTASQKGALSFVIKPTIPFIKDYAKEENDGGGKLGKVYAENDTIILSGKMNLYNILFEGQLKVLSHNGEIITKKQGIEIRNSDEVLVVFGVSTNYEICKEVFLEDNPKKKLSLIKPHQRVCKIIKEASLTYEKLKENHITDYKNLFERVNVDIYGEEYPELYTDELLKLSKEKHIPYLETLYFQYGRYLLISSSRKGCLPANLQGIWNCHDVSPWGSGYWHNINVQMNYWPAFNTNLIETFESYVDFFNAFLEKAQKYADEYIKKHNPENFKEGKGENGWAIGTACYPYTISSPGGHSGPGTGGLTSKLFWEYYDFTRDEEILRNCTYPILEGMSKFLTKTVKNYNGQYLTSFSASPEQMLNGDFIPKGSYYQTVGCAFDQQMIYENGKDLLRCSEMLGITNETIKIQEEQINKYLPVNIGWSGQVKEYIEEKFYGEIGEYRHRHISQLIGLYPGTVINSHTPAWIDAAKYTLDQRGDNSTGWALAHRINAWARTGDGNRCYKLFKELLSNKTMSNLWDTHPPFQIDGNFGGTAGFAEMLLQSHCEYVEVLPGLPDVWEKGEYSGLAARGAFEVSVKWENGDAYYMSILSKKGQNLKLKYHNISTATITSQNKAVAFEILDKDIIFIQTTAENTYEFINIKSKFKLPRPQNLIINKYDLSITWDEQEGITYNVYRACNSEPYYTKIAEKISQSYYQDDIDFSKLETVTYKVTACKEHCESRGAFKTINHATQLEYDRFINQLKGRNYII